MIEAISIAVRQLQFRTQKFRAFYRDNIARVERDRNRQVILHSRNYVVYGCVVEKDCALRCGVED